MVSGPTTDRVRPRGIVLTQVQGIVFTMITTRTGGPVEGVESKSDTRRSGRDVSIPMTPMAIKITTQVASDTPVPDRPTSMKPVSKFRTIESDENIDIPKSRHDSLYYEESIA